jgi:hypothetical protein
VLTVLQGRLTEHRRSTSSPSPRTRVPRSLAPRSQRVFAPRYIHEIVNDTLEPAVSLHIYFPGLTEMTPYATTVEEPVRR